MSWRGFIVKEKTATSKAAKKCSGFFETLDGALTYKTLMEKHAKSAGRDARYHVEEVTTKSRS